jgi:thiosulfate/3-mercaptopyruvate sulfurtransferase
MVDMTDDDLQYTRFHLPGAVRLAYHELLQPRVPGKPAARLDDAQFAALLGRLGITRNTHVVIYDDMGGLNAGRLFLELERIRHPEVSVLDGGLVQWVLSGKRVDNIPHLRKPVSYRFGTEQRANLATLAEVRHISGQAAPVLLDVRSRDEYTGNPNDARSGHIPGAQWWSWEQSINMESGFTFHEADKLAASLAKFGLKDRHAPVVLYCQSGHRASQSYLTLRRLGFDNVRVHTGSMLEYLLDNTAPLARGLAP